MTFGNYPDLKHVKRILVIKMRHHGDVLLSSPVFSNLKRYIPHAQIDAFINKDTLPMLEGHPSITDFILYDRHCKKLPFLKKIFNEVKLLKEIRSRKYDLILNLTEGDRGLIASLVSKSPIRVGFEAKPSKIFPKNKIYTHVIKHCPRPRHNVESQIDVIRNLGIFPKDDERELLFHLPENAKQKVKTLLKEKGFSEGNYILIHPPSRWLFKSVPTKLMADVIKTLHAAGENIILSAGPGSEEMAMIQEILALAPHVGVLNCAGQLTLKELGVLIHLSKALICVDSVPLHMASALKTPVVALFGPSSEQVWGPWMNPQARVVKQNFSCMPCHQAGCANSFRSECLFTMPQHLIMSALNEILT